LNIRALVKQNRAQPFWLAVAKNEAKSPQLPAGDELTNSEHNGTKLARRLR
jgi:hypothetical protein